MGLAASEKRKRARDHDSESEDCYEIGDEEEENESIGEDDFIDAAALKRIKGGKSQRDDSDDDDGEDDEVQEEDEDEGEEQADGDLKRTRGKKASDTKASASASTSLSIVSKKRLSTDDFDVHCKDWVRMKTGIYKGDIGQAVEVHPNSRQVTVKLVPRINVHKFKTKDFHRKKNKPALVNLKQLEKLGIPVTNIKKGGKLFKSFRMEFENGYLIKRVNFKKIYASPEAPKADELDLFINPERFDPEESSDVEEEMPKRTKTTRAKGKKAKASPEIEINSSSFKKLDKVKVLEGTHKGCVGRVRKVNGNAVFMASENLGILRIHKDQLERCYELADHVRIASGIHQDLTGVIVQLEGDGVLVHCDTIKEDIEVSKDCLGEVLAASEILAEKLNERDLVLIDQLTFGMIIEFDTISNTLKILKGDGDQQEVMEIKPKDVKKKVSDEHAKGIDASSRYVRLKDTVQVQEGPLAGKKGVVEHIYENFLFFHDPEHTENHGHLCANARFCVLRNTEVLNAPSLTANTNGAPPRKRHHMLGKEVKIKRGIFKGFKGRVVRGYNKVVHVFVGALLREVAVKEEIVASLEPEVATGGSHSDPNAGQNENGWEANGVQAQDNGGWDDSTNGGGGGWEIETGKDDEKNPVLGDGGGWGDHQNKQNSGSKGWGASGDVHENSGEGWGGSGSIQNNAENSSKGWGASEDLQNSEENLENGSGGNQNEEKTDIRNEGWEASGNNLHNEENVSFSKGWGENSNIEEQCW